jgi:hypothetical protein
VNVIYCHIQEQGGFSHPGLTDTVDVGKAVLQLDTEKLVRISPVRIADGGEWF